MGRSKELFMRERENMLNNLAQMKYELDRIFEWSKEEVRAYSEELKSHRHSNKKEEWEILDKGM